MKRVSSKNAKRQIMKIKKYFFDSVNFISNYAWADGFKIKIKKSKSSKEKLLESFGYFKDDSFEFIHIESFCLEKSKEENAQIISDKTCNDLDFQELFMSIDRTSSRVGQQYLYNQLRTIPQNSNEIEKNEKLIEKFATDSDFRVNIQLQLSKLKNRNAFFLTTLFQKEHIKPPKWFFVVPLLSLSSLISLLLIPFVPNMILLSVGIFIINLGIHYWNKNNLYEYLLSLPQLLKLNKVAKELFKNDALKHLNPQLLNSIKEIEKAKNRMATIRLESQLENDYALLFWIIIDLLKIVFLLEPLFFFSILQQLNSKRKELKEVFEFVGLIDTLISVTSLRSGLNYYCIPELIKEEKKLIAKDIYHPLIPDCIKNSIRVDGKSILLTGSNMSGKTTFIRTIGINVITGLTLNTCFAKQFSMSRLNLYSAIRISDDLMNDKSYYFEEVLTIKEMLDKSENGAANLFLLDEIFKGTNTVERISAGKAVLSFLAKANNIVFVSTHDIELADLLKEEYELYHFSEQVDDKMVAFDYKLKEGKLKNRNAIKILKLNEYPDIIIEQATQLAKEMDHKSSAANKIFV